MQNALLIRRDRARPNPERQKLNPRYQLNPGDQLHHNLFPLSLEFTVMLCRIICINLPLLSAGLATAPSPFSRHAKAGSCPGPNQTTVGATSSICRSGSFSTDNKPPVAKLNAGCLKRKPLAIEDGSTVKRLGSSSGASAPKMCVLAQTTRCQAPSCPRGSPQCMETSNPVLALITFVGQVNSIPSYWEEGF